MNFTSLRKNASTKFRNFRKKFGAIIDKHPMISFAGFLALLLVLVIIGSILRKPEPTPEAQVPEPELVDTYAFGDSPKMTFSAKVEKSGVITVMAQSSGIVQKINVTEGKKVSRGTSLVSLSTTYQGGNTASLARQIAQKNFDSTNDTYQTQLDLIGKQRDTANKADTQASEMRSITRESLDRTRDLVNLNQDIVNGLSDNLNTLVANGGSPADILTAKQGLLAAQSGLSQLKAGLQNAEFTSSDSTTSAQLADLSKDVANKQLDLQEKGLALSKDISELNLKLARVSEQMMYPASPVAGVVQRVYVKQGQSVSSGTVIATLQADKGENTAVVLVPRDVASQMSLTEAGEFMIGADKVSIFPRFISKEATDGDLYSVLFTIPTEYGDHITNTSSLTVRMPIGTKKIVTDQLFVPLDSIYQTQDKSYVYVISDDNGNKTAKTVEVELSEVSGQYVRVNSGLQPTDTVIVSRSVQQGDKVRTE